MKKIIGVMIMIMMVVNILPAGISVQAVQPSGTFKVTLSKDKYCVLVNTTKEEQPISIEGVKEFSYNLLKYNNKGKVDYLSYDNKNKYNITLQPGQKMKIQLESGKVDIYVPNQLKSKYKIENGLILHTFNMDKGQTYEFSKSKGSYFPIAINSKYKLGCDFIEYDAKTISTRSKKNASSWYGLAIDNDYTKARIRLNSVSVKVAIPMELKTSYKKVNEPVYTDITLKKGETLISQKTAQDHVPVVLFNNSELDESIVYDYKSTNALSSYGQVGKVRQSQRNKSGRIEKVFHSDEVSVTTTSNKSLVISVPYIIKSYFKKTSTPTFKEKSELIINDQKSFNINGDDQLLEEMELIQSRGDNGNTTEIGDYSNENNKMNNISYSAIPSNSIKLSLQKEKYYEIINKTNSNQTIFLEGMVEKSSYFYFNYDSNGIAKGAWTYDKSKGISNYTLQPGEKYKIQLIDGNINLYLANELKNNYKTVVGKLYESFTMNKGETYEFSRSNNHEFLVRIYGDESFLCDNYVRQSRNYVESYVRNGKVTGISLFNDRVKARLTVKQGSAKIYVPIGKNKCYQKVSDPAFSEIEIKKGQSVVADELNKNAVFISLDTNAKSDRNVAYDIVSFSDFGDGHGGYIFRKEKNRHGDLDWNYKNGNNISLTVTSETPMILYVPYTFKALFKRSNYPTISEIKLKTGESLNFKHSNYGMVKLFSDTLSNSNCKYDYVYYHNKVQNSKYIENKLNMDLKLEYDMIGNNYEEVHLTKKSGSEEVITVTYPHTKYVKKVSTPCMKEFTIQPNEKRNFVNIDNINMNIYFNEGLKQGENINMNYYGPKGEKMFSSLCAKSYNINSNTSIFGEKKVEFHNQLKNSVKICVPSKYAVMFYKGTDVNIDGKTDLKDIAVMSSLYNYESTKSNKYNIFCDLNNDKIIELYDLVKISRLL